MVLLLQGLPMETLTDSDYSLRIINNKEYVFETGGENGASSCLDQWR
jgi:hypothetical protein